MSDQEDHLIVVDTKILQEIIRLRWFELEAPLIACPITFRLKPSETSTGGLLFFTRGAIYILNKKVFSAATLFKKFHLLDCESFSITQTYIELVFRENPFNPESHGDLEIKSNFSIQIAIIMLRIFNELTFGLTYDQFFKINLSSDVPESILQDAAVKKRPYQALKMRAMSLCHFYNLYYDRIVSANYFDIYDNNVSRHFIITQSFQPGIFSKAFGHAIAWESSVTTIVFRGFNSPSFSEVLNSILQNANGFKALVFHEYLSPIQSKFDFSGLTQLNITNWTFQQNNCNFISYFLNQLKTLNLPIETLNLLDTIFSNEHECIEFFETVSRVRSTMLIESLFISKIISRPFPFGSFQRFISTASNLRMLIFNSVDIDATKILKILSSQPMKNLEKLVITQMQFRTIIDEKEMANLHLPSNLLYINVSGCFFTPSSLRFLLSFITKDPVEVPFIFEANEISVKSRFYNCLSKMDFSKVNPNICEVSWNSNSIPSNSIRFFFAFLFTQKRLRMLSLIKARSENPTQLLKFVMQLIASFHLPAIDISFEKKNPTDQAVDREIYLQFIAALGQASFMKRIGLANANLGDEGLNLFKDVINNLPLITEITADGFNPTQKDSFIGFWESVIKHTTIRAVDKPRNDYISLRDQKILTNKDPTLYPFLSEIRKIPKITTPIQREEYIKILIDENRLTNNPDVFLGASQIDRKKNNKYKFPFKIDDSGLVQQNFQSED